jgi:hypothetical protein
MMHSGNAYSNGQNIIAGTNTMAAVMLPLITTGGSTDRVRWQLHHCQMGLWTGVDILVIIVGWYDRPALMFSSSQPDGTPV